MEGCVLRINHQNSFYLEAFSLPKMIAKPTGNMLELAEKGIPCFSNGKHQP